jgi:hypothetical protein
MAKITALPVTDVLSGDEHLPIVQGKDTKRTTMAAFRDLITPYLQNWYKGDTGDNGPADNTYTSYAAMQASDPTRKSARLVGDTDNPPRPDGPYNNPTQAVGGWVPQRADGISYRQAGAAAIARPAQDKMREFASVRDFGAKGDGVTDDTAALQAAFNAATALRGLFFPPGRYCISDTLKAPIALSSFQLSGSSGYDGVRGPINHGLATSLLWIGPADQTKAMVQFDQSSGVRWKGISLNCDGKASFGLQFMSSSPDTGGVKCIVENCSIHYARLDGIIVGQQGVPSAPPAGRQFFGNVFRNLTFYGCLQSSIHINEWNADQQLFDSVMSYFDDRPNPLPVDNMIWFDHGGQWSRLINCQVGGLTVAPGFPHSGYMIRNQGSDNSISGAFGLLIDNCWQEGEGGLYFGVTSTNDNKGFTFINCASFTSNPANPSVYIDKGTSDRIAHTFIGCAFASDIKVGTSAFRKEEIEIVNCTFSAGKGLVDSQGRRSVNGVYTPGNTAGGVIVVPRFVDTLICTMVSNIGAVYAEGVGKVGDRITLIVTQDAAGGRTINWSGGSMSTLPVIPQPSTAAGAKTIYQFTSDGVSYYLTSVVGAA